jgi:hypothetical protein
MTIRYPNGDKKIIIEKFQHREGLLFFEPFWHLNGLQQGVHLISGEITGEGPWKIADHVITVTGCQGTDAEMAQKLNEWQTYLATPEIQYPAPEQIAELAGKLGAV